MTSSPYFSIIIPHYNNPSDLQRCLDSVPCRDDLEVIVVDDHSDPGKVDFEHFPGLDRPDTSVVFCDGKAGKGPGYARNVGLERAKGRWVVFSDSDDYFTPAFGEVLDRRMGSDAEVIYFKVCRRSTDGAVRPYALFNDAIDQARSSGVPDPISFGVPSPVAKMIRRDFLMSHGIRYQQITCGDDILFSVRMALSLRRHELSDDVIYCVCDRPGSLTRNNDWHSFRNYTIACCEAFKLMAPAGRDRLAYSWTASWWGRLWAESRPRALAMLPRVAAAMGPLRSLHCLKKAVKVGKWKWDEA